MGQLKHPRHAWVGAGACCAVVLVAIASACSINTSASEIDRYQSAVNTQTKAEALKFIDQFGNSHLVPDLIESLPPDVALEVCTELSGSTADNAARSCEPLMTIAHVAPAASSVPPPPHRVPTVEVPVAKLKLPPPARSHQIAPAAGVATPETPAQTASVHTEVSPVVDEPSAPAGLTTPSAAADPGRLESTNAKEEVQERPEERDPGGMPGESMVKIVETGNGASADWLFPPSDRNTSSKATEEDANAASNAALKAKAQAKARAKAAAEARAKAKKEAKARAKAKKALAERNKDKSTGRTGGKRDSKN